MAANFGRKLAEARRKRGLTQVQLAEKLGVSAPSITYYEAGSHVPRPKRMVKLARIVGMNVRDLFGDAAAAKDVRRKRPSESNGRRSTPHRIIDLKPLTPEQKRIIRLVLKFDRRRQMATLQTMLLIAPRTTYRTKRQ